MKYKINYTASREIIHKSQLFVVRLDIVENSAQRLSENVESDAMYVFKI